MINRATLAVEEARERLRRQAQFDWIETYCDRELAEILRLTRSAEDELESVIQKLEDLH